METEKHKQEVSQDVALPTATATTTTTSKSKPRLVVPGAEEDKIQEKTPMERKTSRFELLTKNCATRLDHSPSQAV
eukprot:symbB.v1.2.009184.t1/scaffold575.1/size184962/5